MYIRILTARVSITLHSFANIQNSLKNRNQERYASQLVFMQVIQAWLQIMREFGSREEVVF